MVMHLLNENVNNTTDLSTSLKESTRMPEKYLIKFVPFSVNDADANQYWYTHAPNYFFPKIDHYPDFKTAALVFLASAMSLIMLILLLIVILYRMNHHVREQRELQSQLRTISELLGNNNIYFCFALFFLLFAFTCG